MGRRIYHRRWDVQDGKWQVKRREDEFTTGDGTSKMGSSRLSDDEFTTGDARWEVAGNEMGRRIYHMTWDFQDGKWQEMRWENKFSIGDGWDV